MCELSLGMECLDRGMEEWMKRLSGLTPLAPAEYHGCNSYWREKTDFDNDVVG